MKEAKVIKIPVKEATRHLTVNFKLKGARAFGWRVKLGLAFITFGMWLTGVKYEVDHAA